jgi:hypothetical protein
LLTVGALLQGAVAFFERNAQRMESDGSQVEACECDRDPRAVVLAPRALSEEEDQ